MATISIFDVLGPNMIGPSSSHTAGACSIGRLAYKMLPPPVTQVEFTLYGSFAKTYRGHGTDRALLGGVLGIGISYGLSYALNHLVAGSNALGGMLGFGMMDGMQVNISVIPPWLVLLALVFSTCVGIISGFYPANRAVKISALEAITPE